MVKKVYASEHARVAQVISAYRDVRSFISTSLTGPHSQLVCTNMYQPVTCITVAAGYKCGLLMTCKALVNVCVCVRSKLCRR